VSEGAFSPRPGPAPLPRMLVAQLLMETRLLLLNGEQLLLTIVIPTLVLVLFSTVNVVDLGAGQRVNSVLPGVLAIAVMSTAFTGQAIATGFERRYGVLKRVALTPLPRWGFITAKTGSVVLVELGVISWVRHKYMDSPWSSAVIQVMLGGLLVFGVGLLIGMS